MHTRPVTLIRNSFINSFFFFNSLTINQFFLFYVVYNFHFNFSNLNFLKIIFNFTWFGKFRSFLTQKTNPSLGHLYKKPYFRRINNLKQKSFFLFRNIFKKKKFLKKKKHLSFLFSPSSSFFLFNLFKNNKIFFIGQTFYKNYYKTNFIKFFSFKQVEKRYKIKRWKQKKIFFLLKSFLKNKKKISKILSVSKLLISLKYTNKSSKKKNKKKKKSNFLKIKNLTSFFVNSNLLRYASPLRYIYLKKKNYTFRYRHSINTNSNRYRLLKIRNLNLLNKKYDKFLNRKRCYFSKKNKKTERFNLFFLIIFFIITKI